MGNKIIKLNTSSSNTSAREAPSQDVYVDISMVSKPNNNNEPHLTDEKYKLFVMLAQEHPELDSYLGKFFIKKVI